MSWIQDLAGSGRRRWEQMYRQRWEHDRVVRSTHGVNCTGGCSWQVYVKDGIITWELQATDYPPIDPDLPPHEPRGCQRGITFSWYNYSPLRVKHPYVRGVLLDLWREALARHPDPVEAWAALIGDEESRRRIQQARGRGGLRRASWEEALAIIAGATLHTVKKYGPDRVLGFSPIPAMSMISYCSGTRFLQLLGGVALSFYDWYADFPPAEPEVWGEKTDVNESADWYNSRFIAVTGNNLDMTRTPDAHFAIEARHNGTRLAVFSPDFSQVSKHADWWLPVNAGQDGAFWMAVNHVILKEFFVDREVPAFSDYLRRYTDAPFLVELEEDGGAWKGGRFLRANALERYRDVELGEWKLLVFDRLSAQPRLPQGSIGFRWQEQPGRWNLEPKDGLDGAAIEPLLSLLEGREGTLPVRFRESAGGVAYSRAVPVRWLATGSGRVAVTTVFDLLAAQLGVDRGLEGEGAVPSAELRAPSSVPGGGAGTRPEGAPGAGVPGPSAPAAEAPSPPYTPAWQERYTGVGRETVTRFAREWAGTAERTGGRCSIIVGSGVNHWYQADLAYRAMITSLLLCGCVGVNGGGLNHYTGQEKIVPESAWRSLAFALDWAGSPRLQNAPSFHYVHCDQWRYDPPGREGEVPFGLRHAMDMQVRAVRQGWLPFYPQFDRNPLELVREAEEAGCRDEAQIRDWLARQLKERKIRFAVEDPDAPRNWPRIWFIWRGNALLTSAKGHELFLRHYLGTGSNAVAEEAGAGAVQDAVWREPAPEGKLDLVVDLNFRLDSSALYSDVILPAATWYEKDDLNSTDLHSYLHPLSAAVPPSWESRDDWEIFKAIAGKVSELARVHFPQPVRDLVATPLQHDTPMEIAQPRIEDWYQGGAEPAPGRNLPQFSLVERDYVNLHRRLITYGRRQREEGMRDHGLRWEVADIYDDFLRRAPATEWDGKRYLSMETAKDAADVLLHFAPESNGELAVRSLQALEERTGRPLADLAGPQRAVRWSFGDLLEQPRRMLPSACWSGIPVDGRAYAAYCLNTERLVPWRTLTGRQHLYLDHPAYLEAGEGLPTFKSRLGVRDTRELRRSLPEGKNLLVVNCLTPHGKWHIHTTYYDTLTMLTLSRGVEPFWLNDRDAGRIGVRDNDWVEVYNDNGVIVTRAAVSARIPRGVGLFYHAPERTIDFPRSSLRSGLRGGSTNSLTRIRLKPQLMVGGYAQLCYAFNAWGPPASDRDTYTVVRRLEGT